VPDRFSLTEQRDSQLVGMKTQKVDGFSMEQDTTPSTSRGWRRVEREVDAPTDDPFQSSLDYELYPELVQSLDQELGISEKEDIDFIR
jgi:hypothetical protein